LVRRKQILDAAAESSGDFAEFTDREGTATRESTVERLAGDSCEGGEPCGPDVAGVLHGLLDAVTCVNVEHVHVDTIRARLGISQAMLGRLARRLPSQV